MRWWSVIPPFALVVALAGGLVPPARGDDVASAGDVEDQLVQAVLDNGLRVTLVPDPRFPRVAVAVSYDVGSRDDPPSARGLAHLTEHVLLRGARRIPLDGWYRFYESLGATEWNGTTFSDHTVYHLVVPRRNVAGALWAEAERMAYGIEIADDHVVRGSRQVVQAEWRQHVGSDPAYRADERLAEALYPVGHGYRYPHDDPGAVGRLGPAQVRWRYQQSYGPEDAHLAVVGDFDVEDVTRLVHRYFGGIRSARSRGPRRIPPPVPPVPTERQVTLRAPVLFDTLHLVWPGPPHLTRDDAVLDVIAAVLRRHQFTFSHELVGTGLDFDRDVTIWHRSAALGSELHVRIVGNTRASARAAFPALDRALSRLREERLPTELLDHVTADLRRGRRGLRDHLRQHAISTARFLPHDDRGLPWPERAAARYAGIDPDTVRSVAATLVNDRRRVTVYVDRDRSAPWGGR